MTAHLTIEYFAAARELVGVPQESLPLSVQWNVRDLLEHLGQRHPRLAPYLPRMRIGVNDELVSIDTKLSPGDRVTLLPPVAGGSTPRYRGRTAVQDTPLSVDQVLAAVSHPSVGGIVLFIGTVRDHADGKAVGRLDYEAHPSLAEKEIDRICASIEVEQPGVRLCVRHRVGKLRVGEAAVVIAAGGAHRDQAFAACRAAIERIKETVPIWKKEWEPNGSAVWVNLEP